MVNIINILWSYLTASICRLQYIVLIAILASCTITVNYGHIMFCRFVYNYKHFTVVICSHCMYASRHCSGQGHNYGLGPGLHACVLFYCCKLLLLVILTLVDIITAMLLKINPVIHPMI